MRKLLTLTAAAALVFALAVGFGAPASAQNLVGYWNFDSPPADPVLDEAPAGGVADDGTFAGDADYQGGSDIPGIPGNVDAMEVDGAGDYLSVAHSADLDITGPITLAAWINPDSLSGFQEFINKGDFEGSAGSFTYFLLLMCGCQSVPAGTIRFGIDIGGTGDRVDSIGTVSTGVWTHVAVTFDPVSDAVNIYLNGLFDNSGSITGNPVANTEPLYIGALKNFAGTLNDFGGLIDDVRIYNRVLTAAEVAQLATTFTITKELVSADEEDETTNDNSLIDLNEEWAFVLKVTLTNNGPGDFTNLTVIDPLPGDNELGNLTSRLKKDYDVKDPDDSSGVCPNTELDASTGSAEAFGTGNSAKCHVTWDIPVLNSLGEVTLEMNTSTDLNPRGLRPKPPKAGQSFQEYTFTGPYCLNQGATLKGTIVEVPFEQESDGVEVDNINPGGGFELQEDDNCDGAIVSGTLVNVIDVFVP